MVSPCKKKKVEKKGRPTPEPNPPRNSISSRRLKSSKPLSDKKFYLDIKNHASLRQIEAKLTSLGAKLELFLVKDVNCVVTDRDDYPRHRQLGLVTPSPFCSVSPATTDSPTDGVISKRTRSRAEAMLERVRQQPQKNTIDILDNAIAWGIPIYSLSKFLVWLEKLVRKRSSEPGVRELRGNFLKIETGAAGRPDFRQFRAWPRISYSDEDPAAFPPPKPLSRHDPQRMTRKVGKTGKDGSSAPGGGNGYCEICRVHYDQLDTHVSSSQHTKLVSDPTQYSQLDSLISHHDLGNVTSLRKSLRIAKSPPVEMGGKQSCEPPTPPPMPTLHVTMNGHVTRSRTDKVLCNGLSPVEKRKKEIRASGGSSSSSHNDKLEREQMKEREREAKEKERELKEKEAKEREREAREREREARETERVKREREREAREREREAREREREAREREREARERREREAKEKEREAREREREARERREREAKEKEREAREREAKEKESTRVDDKGTDHNLRSRHSSSKQATPQPKRNRLSSRKRLSVEEKLIEDNKSYYKVEVLNSKLRSTEYFISQKQLEARVNGNDASVNGCEEKPLEKEVKEPVVVRFKKVRKTQLAVLSDEAENFMFGDLTRKEMESKVDSDSSEDSGGRADSDSSSEEEETPRKKKKRKSFNSSSDKREFGSSSPRIRYHPNFTTPQSHGDERKTEKSDDEEPQLSLNDITFSFEKPPKNEPWMDSYKPEKEEDTFYFPHYHEYPRILLPYEYPPSERLKLLSARRPGFGRRRDRISQLIDEGKPRKSPRCHASTLAIMSSLMRRRPIRECTSNPDFTYEEESRSSLPETVESSSSASDARITVSDSTLLPVDPSDDAYAIALVRLLCGETNTFQVAPGPCLPVDPAIINDPSLDINLGPKPGLDVPLENLFEPTRPLQNKLLDFDFRQLNLDRDYSGSECSDLIGFGDDLRGVGRRRKRKRNMTGWPVGKPRKKIVKIKEEDPPPTMKSDSFNIDAIPVKSEYPFKAEPDSEDDTALPLPVIPMKRGRGRPRKYPMIFPPSSFSSPPMSPKSSPKKKCIPRFTFGPRRSCIK